MRWPLASQKAMMGERMTMANPMIMVPMIPARVKYDTEPSTNNKDKDASHDGEGECLKVCGPYCLQ